MDPRNSTSFDFPQYIPVQIPSPDDFDPHSEPISFFYPDASNFTFTFNDVDAFKDDQLQTTIVFAIQIGMAIVTLFVMFFMTEPPKRKAPVFLLNLFSVIVVLVRGSLYCQYFTGPYGRVYTTFTWDTSDVPKEAEIKSIVSSVLSLILMLSTQISMIIQLKICWSMNKMVQRRLMVFCIIVSFISTGAYWALGLYVIQLGDRQSDPAITSWAYPVVNAFTGTSIAIFSALFVWRMWVSARNRASMGFRGFGALESLALSGLQCMVLPAFFVILENWTKFGGSSSLAQAFIAFALPLSHLWAAKLKDSDRLDLNTMLSPTKEKPSFKNRVAREWGSYTVELHERLTKLGKRVKCFVFGRDPEAMHESQPVPASYIADLESGFGTRMSISENDTTRVASESYKECQSKSLKDVDYGNTSTDIGSQSSDTKHC